MTSIQIQVNPNLPWGGSAPGGAGLSNPTSLPCNLIPGVSIWSERAFSSNMSTSVNTRKESINQKGKNSSSQNRRDNGHYGHFHPPQNMTRWVGPSMTHKTTMFCPLGESRLALGTWLTWVPPPLLSPTCTHATLPLLLSTLFISDPNPPLALTSHSSPWKSLASLKFGRLIVIRPH